jgi:hydroxymethylpyrimidine/phosphomethylpyrimidine kinase
MHSQLVASISIAGFDPSGGAGLLADIKTFEDVGVYACGVCTTITFQNANQFNGLEWISAEAIIKQLEILEDTFLFKAAKIGLVENIDILGGVIRALKNHNPEIKIVLDPVWKASAGFRFHESPDMFFSILNELALITPNLDEIRWISGNENVREGARMLAKYCPVYLKDGHGTAATVNDILWMNEDTKIDYQVERLNTKGKHGSGCVFSSAVTAYLFLEHTLEESCKMAKVYVRGFLQSNESLIGYHGVKKNDDALH